MDYQVLVMPRAALVTPTTLTLVIYRVRPRAKRVEVVEIRPP